MMPPANSKINWSNVQKMPDGIGCCFNYEPKRQRMRWPRIDLE